MLKNTLFLSLLLCFCIVKGQYPPNIFADTAFAPFYYGVASGDPLQHNVILWTKTFVLEGTTQPIPLKWTIANDSNFNDIVQQGTVSATLQHDYTAKVDAGFIDPGQIYYYRFETGDGKKSQTGIARTLPADTVTQFKLAVVSCSSIWSGFFNAYRRIAERSDIDYVLHLGDYVYDYADDHQLNRMPAAPVKDCASRADWNERHTYYLLDPDLRAARQNKTWIAEWDNHDTDVEAPGKQIEAIEAFLDYLPIRSPDVAKPENIYRRFQFGKLADLNMIDMQLFRGKEEYEPGKKSVLGLEQDAWLKKNLAGSTAQWHLIGNQEMMTDWLSEGAPKFLKHGNGRVFDDGNWNGFPDDRNRLYAFFDSLKLKNLIVLTGDIHMSFVMNMTATPKDKKLYNRRTGQGAVGVEITGPSISRINMKEAGVPGGLIPAVQSFSRGLNPHHVWCQFSKHGYFTLNVTAEKCEADFWYVDIKKQTTKESFGRGFTVTNGVNHWDKKQVKGKR